MNSEIFFKYIFDKRQIHFDNYYVNCGKKLYNHGTKKWYKPLTIYRYDQNAQLRLTSSVILMEFVDELIFYNNQETLQNFVFRSKQKTFEQICKDLPEFKEFEKHIIKEI